MAAWNLPTPEAGYPDATVRVALDGTSFILRWLWNERGGCWSMSLSDADGNPILMGVRVAVGTNLLERSSDERLPIGPFMVVDPTGDGSDPGLTELGGRVKVVYFDAGTWV